MCSGRVQVVKKPLAGMTTNGFFLFHLVPPEPSKRPWFLALLTLLGPPLHALKSPQPPPHSTGCPLLHSEELQDYSFLPIATSFQIIYNPAFSPRNSGERNSLSRLFAIPPPTHFEAYRRTREKLLRILPLLSRLLNVLQQGFQAGWAWIYPGV